MNYIEQHSNSELLKLGIKMALYREKKPEKRYALLREGYDHEADEIIEENDKWQQSRIAYLKEPEFKVDNLIWWNKLRYRIIKIEDEWIILSDKMSGEEGFMITKEMYNELSHYYPGQQVESFKYVREVIKKGDIFIINEHDDEWEAKVVQSNQWNRLEFDSFKHPVTDVSLQDALRFNNCRIINRTPEWQEVEEPELHTDWNDHEAVSLRVDKHTQFQEDLDKGIILAEICDKLEELIK